jgi:hypothetical protein
MTLGTLQQTLTDRGVPVDPLPPFNHTHPVTGETALVDWACSSMWRPDETLIHEANKRIVHIEFTRPWDGNQQYVSKQEEIKTNRYRPWVSHIRNSLAPLGWQVDQLNFTIGARGSIDIRSWSAHLEALSYPPTSRETLFRDLHHQALVSLRDVFQAFKAGQLTH